MLVPGNFNYNKPMHAIIFLTERIVRKLPSNESRTISPWKNYCPALTLPFIQTLILTLIGSETLTLTLCGCNFPGRDRPDSATIYPLLPEGGLKTIWLD